MPAKDSENLGVYTVHSNKWRASLCNAGKRFWELGEGTLHIAINECAFLVPPVMHMDIDLWLNNRYQFWDMLKKIKMEAIVDSSNCPKKSNVRTWPFIFWQKKSCHSIKDKYLEKVEWQLWQDPVFDGISYFITYLIMFDFGAFWFMPCLTSFDPTNLLIHSLKKALINGDI